MSAVTGPIGTNPGSVHALPSGATCDEHSDRQAVARVQGETDSFGSELIDMCRSCYDEHKAEKESRKGGVMVGVCSSCKSGEQVPLFAWRDYEEGSCGPLYYYCDPCKTSINERQYAEIERDRAEAGYDYSNED